MKSLKSNQSLGLKEKDCKFKFHFISFNGKKIKKIKKKKKVIQNWVIKIGNQIKELIVKT